MSVFNQQRLYLVLSTLQERIVCQFHLYPSRPIFSSLKDMNIVSMFDC